MIAPGLLAVRRGQDQGDHRLGHHAGGGHGARIGALAQRLGGLLGGEFDRPQRQGHYQRGAISRGGASG